MKICKYCNSVMISEYETNRNDSHRFFGFHVCPKCRAVFEEDVTEKNSKRIIHMERWFNPSTKQFE